MSNLICIGDSITVGTYTALGDSAPLSVANPNFSEILKNRLQMDTLINYGENGISYSSLSDVRSEDALANRCNTFSAGDMVILAAGTNDYGTNVPIGNADDVTDISFYGAVDTVMKCLKEKNPDGIIFVVLPIPRQEEDANKSGHSLMDYRNAIRTKAMKYNLPVIDGNRLNINPQSTEDLKNYMPDGTHPNKIGHQMYAELLYNEICKFKTQP